MEKIKVLQVIRLAEGGMREHFLSLLKNLDQNKFSLAAAGPFSDDLTRNLENSGIKVYPLPIPSSIDLWKDLGCLVKLKRILTAEKIDLIHSHGSKAAFIGRLAAKLAQTPSSIFTTHNFILDNYQSRSKKLLFTLLEQRLSGMTQKIITVSQALQEELQRQQHIPPEKIITVYNGIEISDFQTAPLDIKFKKALGFTAQDLIVGTVARLIPEKGLQYLLESALHIITENPQLKIGFLIVGDGPFRSFLEKQVQQMGLEKRVIFTGYREDVKELLKIMDIFLLPSLSEGLGISLLEAMAMKKPLIGSRVGGIPEVIQEGRNGYLVNPGDSLALTESILLLIHHPERMTQMGEEGRKILERNFSLQKMIERIEEIYLSSLGLKS